METNSFVDLIKKFGNNNPNNFEPIKTQSANLDSIYPYGQFPIEKTKGYDPSKNKKDQVEALGFQNNDNYKHEEIRNHENNNLFGNLDLKTILPLMSSIKNKHKLSTYDLFNLIMPTMYRDNPNLKEIVKYFAKNDEPPKQKLPPSKMQAIDSYVKA